MLHLSHFSNVCTNHLQKSAAKICTCLEEAPDQIMERNQLRQMCSVGSVDTKFKIILERQVFTVAFRFIYSHHFQC